MRKPFKTLSAVGLLCLLFAASGTAQVINATLSGTVSDASGAFIPGTEITATNTGTGVISRALTNESGTYRFASLQPGTYEVSAALSGFQTQAFLVTLGTAQQIRQNFTLVVGGVTQAVEVIVAADEQLTTAQATVGRVLAERQISELPLVSRQVTDLATILPGVVGSGGTDTTFAGIRADGTGNVSLLVDGMIANNPRFRQGLNTATFINPDMVEEVRVNVATVDVEARGSAQLQMRTRSGTNQYRGAAVWNIENSVLNANTWANNRQRISPPWFNRNQYTVSLGGPLVRNKTFFFGLFEGQRSVQKQTVDTTVLTDDARRGIFRFFPGVNNGHAEFTTSGSGNTLRAPVVDAAGNALDWRQVPGAIGPMQTFNVFGDALNPGDPFRRQMDPSGFMARLLQKMPRANAFNGGDGLNTATHRWVRRTVGPPAGSGGSNPLRFDRSQVNLKIDHHFDQNHTLTGGWMKESRYTDNLNPAAWPNGWNGEQTADPTLLTLRLTSTLSPNVVNEVRYGFTNTNATSMPSWLNRKDGKFGSRTTDAWDFLTVMNGIPVRQLPTLFGNHVYGGGSASGNKTPISSYANTLSWVRGTHAMRFGAEFRRTNSRSWSGSIPSINGGAGDVPVRGIDTIAGMLPANITLANDILLSLSGSVSSASQEFYLREPDDARFVSFEGVFHPDNPEGQFGRIRTWRQDEFNFFLKDDWRVTPNFTLNLGVRYELMGVPSLRALSGKNFTVGPEGGNAAIFGYSGRSFSEAWMSGGGPQKGDLTRVVPIGPGTPHPKQGIWPSDKNNWAPAIGFAWSPQWWGQDKTTIRAGYQVAYQLPGNSFAWVEADAGGLPGLLDAPTDRGAGTFRDFTNVTIPLPLVQVPFEPIPITQGSQDLALFDANYVTPYVQTFTAAVTRSLASNVTLDVRYVGTRGVKLHGSVNINDADFRNNGLLQALQITRGGGNAELFDRMLRGLNIGSGVVGVSISGSEALRRHASFRTIIANGDFVAVARLLATTNIGTVQPPLTTSGLLRSSGQFPPNFIKANPQFGDIMWRTNSDNSNYHSLQTQVTLQPARGVQYQTTYTWSRSLGMTTPTFGEIGFRDLLNQRADYTLLDSHRAHDLRSYGTFELPFGPGRVLGGNTTGWIARLIEGWQVGTIFSINSGRPLSVAGGNTLYSTGTTNVAGQGTPDIVGPFSREGNVVWPLNAGDVFGNYFPQQYQRVPDPACGQMTADLARWCTNTALSDASGNIVLKNAAPGELGTLGLNTLEGPGQWDLDANIQKRIRLDESKRLTFRVDAQNLLNHPTPGNPGLNINSGTFGQITTKTGSRTLQAQIRFDF
jgi:hypothetical protein